MKKRDGAGVEGVFEEDEVSAVLRELPVRSVHRERRVMLVPAVCKDLKESRVQLVRAASPEPKAKKAIRELLALSVGEVKKGIRAHVVLQAQRELLGRLVPRVNKVCVDCKV